MKKIGGGAVCRFTIEKFSEDLMRQLTLEVLHMERKNLRSRAKTDQRMSEEIQKVIAEYCKMGY